MWFRIKIAYLHIAKAVLPYLIKQDRPTNFMVCRPSGEQKVPHDHADSYNLGSDLGSCTRSDHALSRLLLYQGEAGRFFAAGRGIQRIADIWSFRPLCIIG